jgi:futalosine hydrolase
VTSHREGPGMYVPASPETGKLRGWPVRDGPFLESMDAKRILILTATEAELADIRRAAGAGAPETGPVPVLRGRIGPFETVLAATGAGKASAAFAAGWLLARGEYRLLVNVGCAGAFPGTLLVPGDVVIADREILADEGAAAPGGFLDLGAIGVHALDGRPPVHNEVPIHPPCRITPKALADLSRDLGFPVRAGPLCTVSTRSGTDALSAERFARWRPVAESMEGAALALAALRGSLPFVEVRGISNLTGDRDPASWDMHRACARAAAVAVRIIEKIEGCRPPAGEARR